MFEALKSSIQIGEMSLRNRMAMSAMGVEIAEENGHAGEPIIAYYEERARGGVGLIVTEVCAIAYPLGATALRQLALSSDDFLPGLRELTSRVHQHGAKIALQLVHHGKVSRVDMRAGRPLLVPSKPRFAGAMDLTNDLSTEEIGWLMKAVSGPPPSFKEADATDIAWVIESFAAAAERAKRAGFDAIEIHAAHGYLISEFLSPAWNFREDEYGGSPENRARLLCEVIRAIKDRVGQSFPVWPRIDCREFRTPGGITLGDAQRTAELAAEAGADAIHVTAYADATSGVAFTDAPLVHKEAGYVEDTAAIKSRVDVPVIAVGRIEPEIAEKLIQKGRIDIVAMARKLLADPDLPNKIESGKIDDIRPCIYCYTCVAQPYFDRPVRCAVNPITGQEAALAGLLREASEKPRRILIVGGGPAGLEAARVAALRGHDVILCEKSKRLGGTLRFAALVYEPNERLLDWLERQVRELDIELRLRTEVTLDLIREISPDEILVAIGAHRARPEIAGADQDHVFDGEELRDLLMGGTTGSGNAARKLSLTGRIALRAGRATGITESPRQLRRASKLFMPMGSKVVIVGGGLVGLELAEFLAERGRHVTVLESGPKFGLEMAHPRRWRVLHDLRQRGVELVPTVTLHAIGRKDVEYSLEADSKADSGADRSIQRTAADTVIFATGLEANPSLAETLRQSGIPLREIGDVSGPGYLEGAIYDGFHAALD